MLWRKFRYVLIVIILAKQTIVVGFIKITSTDYKNLNKIAQNVKIIFYYLKLEYKIYDPKVEIISTVKGKESSRFSFTTEMEGAY